MSKAQDRIRQGILAKRQPREAKPSRPRIVLPPPDPRKTKQMRLLEALWREPIEFLIGEGKEADIGEQLGVAESTISRWRLRLGLRAANSKSED